MRLYIILQMNNNSLWKSLSFICLSFSISARQGLQQIDQCHSNRDLTFQSITGRTSPADSFIPSYNERKVKPTQSGIGSSPTAIVGVQVPLLSMGERELSRLTTTCKATTAEVCMHHLLVNHVLSDKGQSLQLHFIKSQSTPDSCSL